MSPPDRLFLLAQVPPGGPAEEPTVLFSIPAPDGRNLTPVFSSMAKAASFLQNAQELRIQVSLDYVFPIDRRQFADEFPDHVPMLDPAADAFFASGAPEADH